MGMFIDSVLAFPTVLFSSFLIVAIGYWVLALLGMIDVGPGCHGAGDLGDAGRGLGGLLAGGGLGGVPIAIVLSLLIAIAWLASLAGNALLRGVLGPAAAGAVLLVAAILVAWGLTALLVRPARRLFVSLPAASRRDFVGRPCVIRTRRVGQRFGQAEVSAADGSTAIVQVRQAGTGSLGSGSAAVIYDYDAEGEFFWAMPLDAVHDPVDS